jgi:hypothetical protein
MNQLLRIAIPVVVAACWGMAQAQPKPEGYLCCNMRTDGRWISDSNYLESGKYTVPLGTPIKAVGYARYRVLVEVGGEQQALANDYSRDIAMPDFARRYIVRDNPADKLAGFEPKIREAITSFRVTRGMTREQVLMALSYPISSETPHLDARVWKYWLWTTQRFDVHFGEDGLVAMVRTDPDTRARVVKD